MRFPGIRSVEQTEQKFRCFKSDSILIQYKLSQYKILSVELWEQETSCTNAENEINFHVMSYTEFLVGASWSETRLL